MQEQPNQMETMRESFSLVQNILFNGYTNVIPSHKQENMVENLWETMQFGLFFDNGLWLEFLVPL